MNKLPQTTTPPKKRGRPATGCGTTIGMRLQPDELAALDKAVADQNDPAATRAGVAAGMVVQLLIEDRYLPAPSE